MEANESLTLPHISNPTLLLSRYAAGVESRRINSHVKNWPSVFTEALLI